MTWNYRVVTREVGDHREIGIYSVYYDDQGHPVGVSEEPARVMQYSLEGLADTLQLMKECMDKPVLDWEEIGTEGE